MKQIIIALLLISSSAFGSTSILEKHARSGFVPPHLRFTKDCKIYKEKFVSTIIHLGDGTATGSTRMLPRRTIQTIQVLLRVARRGHIVQTPMPCDIGTNIVKGHDRGHLVEIDSAVDCGERRVNKSWAARRLKRMAGEICGF